MISVRHLEKNIVVNGQNITLLQNINFDLERGQSLAITGRSGSGKTSLLSLLAGLDVPDKGEIYWQEHCISALSEDARAGLRGQYLGFVFQSFQLLPHLNVLENAALPLQLKGDKQAYVKAAHYLEQVGLASRLKSRIHTLSGGEQQRVAIARAFVHQPQYLFADEPTGNLDHQTAAQIIELLFAFNREQQTTLILVTHDRNLAAMCQRELIIEQGSAHER